MRLKSLTQQRIRRTCVGNIFMLCLLTSNVWSFANIKHNRFARQLNDKEAVNYEDFSTTNPYHQPHFIGNRSVVVQLFEWKFVDVAAECRDFLGPQGYAGVQLSPVLEHAVVKTDDFNHPWWERLEVFSYRLASRSGDETDFWSMSRICNENGVRIYVDVVLNHMAAPQHYLGVTEAEAEEEDKFTVSTLLETNVTLAQLNYSFVAYTHNDFHKPTCAVAANTQDAHVIRNCQLNGHPDLDHSRGNVQKHIVEMLNKFVDMGVAGFRIDTAKYMWPIDLKNIFKQVKNLSTEFKFKKNTRPFVYYDVFDLGLDAVSKTEYSTYGVVSEYLYAAELSTILRGKVPLSSLINWGPALGFLPHEDSLVFIDSHDTQRGMPWELGNNQMLTYKQRIKYIMANVFMLVHPYGAIKRVMSSYYFSSADINQGPPVEEADAEEIRSPEYDGRGQCTVESGWVCEHRWPQVVSLVKVANYFKSVGNREESIIYFQTNGPNQVVFCRGQRAFVAINNDAENDFMKEVYACLEPGTYCDMVTGGKKDGLEACQGKILEINEQGYMKLELNVADNERNNNEEGIEAAAEGTEGESDQIPSYGIVVIYVESKIKPADNKGTANKIEGAGNIVENSKEDEGSAAKPSADAGQADERAENDSEQEQENDEVEDKKELSDGQEGVEGENESKAEEPAEKEEKDAAEEKTENEENKEETEIENGATSSETTEPDENQNSVEQKKLEEEDKEGDEKDLLENNENQAQNEEQEEDIEVEDENNSNDEDPIKEEDEEKQPAQDSVEGPPEVAEEPEEKEDQPTGESLEVTPEDQEEPAAEPDEEPSASSDTGNNQSRNLDEKPADETEEQIEKPSAEIVEETGVEISDTVTAKIQDIQKAGIFSNHQGTDNNG